MFIAYIYIGRERAVEETDRVLSLADITETTIWN
jgi:hypothetical protein